MIETRQRRRPLPQWPQNKTMANVELVICSQEVQSNHPELFHYTRPSAFQSIVTSNTFWASHYRDLLDQTEIHLMREKLPDAVAPLFEQIVSSAALNRTDRRLWKKSGRGIGTARDLVNSLYGVTFDKRVDVTAMDAYIVSFSTHSADGMFEREHGVWSQWAEYAGLDGFCIVLDTAELARMLGSEMDSKYWAYLKLDPVRYDDAPIAQLFPELVQASAKTLHQFLRGVRTPEMPSKEFLIGTTLLKAASYGAEREVRIVGIPGTQRMSDEASKDYPSIFKKLPLPEAKIRNGSKRRYIVLFEGMQVTLPIKRVIVGPKGGDQAIALAQSVVGHVPVTLSRCTANDDFASRAVAAAPSAGAVIATSE